MKNVIIYLRPEATCTIRPEIGPCGAHRNREHGYAWVHVHVFLCIFKVCQSYWPNTIRGQHEIFSLFALPLFTAHLRGVSPALREVEIVSYSVSSFSSQVLTSFGKYTKSTSSAHTLKMSKTYENKSRNPCYPRFYQSVCLLKCPPKYPIQQSWIAGNFYMILVVWSFPIIPLGFNIPIAWADLAEPVAWFV